MSEIWKFQIHLAVLLANEHHSDQKNVTNDFRIHFAMYSFTQKRLCHWNARKFSIKENLASRRIITKQSASVFHRI